MSPHLLVKNDVAISFDLLGDWDPTSLPLLAHHREDPLCQCHPERSVRDGETIWLHDWFYRP